MFRQAYARILLDALTTSPVLKELEARTELLSAEQVTELPIDRDADLDLVLRRLKAGEPFSSDTEEEDEGEQCSGEEEEGGGSGGKESTGGAVPSLVAEERPPQDDTSLPNRGTVDDDLAAKDFEIIKLQSSVRNVEVEWEAKYNELQKQFDGLLAELTHKQDELAFVQEEVKGVREEHAEYEEIIRRGDGLTISDAIAEVDTMRARLEDVEERYGKSPWEYSDQVSALRSTMKLYQLLQRRRPEVGRFLKSILVPCFLVDEPASALTVGSHDYEHFDRQLSAVGRGGVTRGQQVPNTSVRGGVAGVRGGC